MQQLSLFDKKLSTNNYGLSKKSNHDLRGLRDVHYWKMFIDGASRNNPGESGAGIYIESDDKPFAQFAFYLGHKTNNQAEYLALLYGLCILKKHVKRTDLVQIVSDSQLLVRQINGEYKVKHPLLQPLHAAAQKLLVSFNYAIAHVLREENTKADELANQAVDKKIPIPDEHVTLLRECGIKFD